MNTPHLEGSGYQNPDQVAVYVRQKCVQLVAAGVSGKVDGASREGNAIRVTVTDLPREISLRSDIERAVRRAFGMTGSSGGPNPHPAHNIIVDPSDDCIRLHTTARRR